MELRFLATAEDGLRWMLHYYARVFPEGRKGAALRYEAAKQLLRDQPKSGKRFADDERVRELKIARTPFSLIYTIADDVIYVIDIRDGRGLRRG